MIDFPSVRDSLKPAIRAEVDKTLDRTMGDAAGRLRDGRLRQQVGPKLLETVLNKVVTPQSIASLYAWRGDISQVLKDVKEIRELGTATDGAGGGGSAKNHGRYASPISNALLARDHQLRDWHRQGRLKLRA